MPDSTQARPPRPSVTTLDQIWLPDVDLDDEKLGLSADSTSAAADRRTSTSHRQPACEKSWQLRVIDGLKVDAVYPLHTGKNVLGRNIGDPVDVDLTGQEAPMFTLVSRKHAAVHIGEIVEVEDLPNRNGTLVNGKRMKAGSRREVIEGDVIQIGTVQLRLN